MRAWNKHRADLATWVKLAEGGELAESLARPEISLPADASVMVFGLDHWNQAQKVPSAQPLWSVLKSANGAKAEPALATAFSRLSACESKETLAVVPAWAGWLACAKGRPDRGRKVFELFADGSRKMLWEHVGRELRLGGKDLPAILSALDEEELRACATDGAAPLYWALMGLSGPIDRPRPARWGLAKRACQASSDLAAAFFKLSEDPQPEKASKSLKLAASLWADANKSGQFARRPVGKAAEALRLDRGDPEALFDVLALGAKARGLPASRAAAVFRNAADWTALDGGAALSRCERAEIDLACLEELASRPEAPKPNPSRSGGRL